MSFLDMSSELAQATPGMSRIYAKTLINRAWRVVRDSTLWSFQLIIDSFATPALLANGHVTCPAFPSPYIIGDATATAAWGALTFPFITQYQFRVGNYSIYNIIAYDVTTNAPFATLTLDRPFVDPVTTLTNNAYQIFQNYIVAPSPTFKRWLSVQDVVNGYSLNIWGGRRDVNFADPMRQLTTNPVAIFGLGQDRRSGIGANQVPVQSSTLGRQMFELWPIPTSKISYMRYYVDRGADLVTNTDTLPDPIPEDVVLIKARAYAYEWSESRKDVMAAKGSGADYNKLKANAEGDFLARLHTLRLEDKDTVDAYMTRMTSAANSIGINPFYNTSIGRAGMGWPSGWPGGWR